MSDPASADLEVVFVCGNSRSGTTMTSRILGSSPDVFTCEELHFFEGACDPSDDAPVGTDHARLLAARLLAIQAGGFRTPEPVDDHLPRATRLVDGLPGGAARDVYAAVVRSFAADAGARVVCDQTPRNVYLLAELLASFPAAQAVVLVRDPRDVLLSQKHRWRRTRRGIAAMSRRDQLRLWASYHPLTTSQLWRSGIVALDRVAGHERVHVVRFEDLVADAETCLRTLCADLEVEFDPAMLAIPRSGSSHGPADADVRGVDSAAAGRWRSGGLSRTEIAVCERVVGPLLATHGYEASGLRPHPLGLVATVVAFPVKAGLALVLNLGRARRLVAAVRRRLAR